MSLTRPASEAFFENNPISAELDKIRRFQYTVRYSDVPLLRDKGVQSGIASIIVGSLIQKLDDLKIFASDNLDVRYEDDGILITFGDDVYSFGMGMSTSRFAFTRVGGKIFECLDLLDKILDSIVEIFRSVESYLEGLKSQGGPVFVFSPHFCEYSFKFTLSDFSPSNKSSRKSYKNYELMERLVPSVQAESSPLHAVGLEQRGRTDLKVSGTVTLEDIEWLSWVVIEAPGNRNYSMMEIEVDLQSVTHGAEDLGRVPFDVRSLSCWRVSVIDYLRDRIFIGFLQNWLNDVNFSSDGSGLR